MTPSACAPLAAMILSMCLCTAQRVVLPGATGGIEPSQQWVLLRQVDLDADTRATDPDAEPGRSVLLTAIAELRQAGQTERTLLLHSPGHQPSGLRMMTAYAAAGGATVDELLSERAVTGVREALEPGLKRSGRTVTFDGAERVDIVPAGGVRLSFDVRGDSARHTHDHYIVPAGEDLQYFECTFARDDADARAAFEALIATFDGSAPPPPGPRRLWIGGVAGALAGVMTALFRRKRQARALAARNEAR